MGITAFQSLQTATWQVRGASTQQLLSGLSAPSTRREGIFSADFLYRVYDAKALNQQVMRNYFQKREAAAAEENPEPPKPRENYKTFVDELMESSDKESGESAVGDTLDIVA